MSTFELTWEMTFLQRVGLVPTHSGLGVPGDVLRAPACLHAGPHSWKLGPGPDAAAGQQRQLSAASLLCPSAGTRGLATLLLCCFSCPAWAPVCHCWRRGHDLSSHVTRCTDCPNPAIASVFRPSSGSQRASAAGKAAAGESDSTAWILRFPNARGREQMNCRGITASPKAVRRPAGRRADRRPSLTSRGLTAARQVERQRAFLGSRQLTGRCSEPAPEITFGRRQVWAALPGQMALSSEDHLRTPKAP
ncbi:PREDICTED: uncharacterized protein LOC106724651 [Myotis brandtii]|uniref:uncharacterized protein LOC106724651 n=1 Tax=Myotis brandtii TaxID=109478 RepID=UPI00070472D0|nr:PREDICTED: uncharacterized protein LOC106724651 [Myotis brandtii]